MAKKLSIPQLNDIAGVAFETDWIEFTECACFRLNTSPGWSLRRIHALGMAQKRLTHSGALFR
jgi:hypothetical protein